MKCENLGGAISYRGQTTLRIEMGQNGELSDKGDGSSEKANQQEKEYKSSMTGAS